MDTQEYIMFAVIDSASPTARLQINDFLQNLNMVFIRRSMVPRFLPQCELALAINELRQRFMIMYDGLRRLLGPLDDQSQIPSIVVNIFNNDFKELYELEMEIFEMLQSGGFVH